MSSTSSLLASSAGARARATSAATRRQRWARRALLSDVLVVALWASGAVAAALYLVSGGIAGFATIGASVTSLGIFAGLIGTNYVLVMILLAARIPLLDRTIGHDRAIALHRRLGKPALYLILAHAVLLIIGYGITDGVDPVAEFFALFGVNDIPLAWLGLGLMIAVVVTSLVAVRRRFSYEMWHAIHLLSYAAVAVSLPHQLSVGGVLAEGTAQRAYWIALFVVAFAAIAWFRFARPAIATLRHGLTVTRTRRIAPDVVAIELRGRQLRRLEAQGGQFFVWRFWSAGTWWHSHPLSLSAAPTDTTMRVTVRDLGSGSRALADLPRGTRVSIEGPYGLFTDRARTAPRLAILAAGIGVTPVRAMLEDADLEPGEATVLLRASDESETYHWDEIRELCQARGARFYTMLGPRARRGARWMTESDAARGVTLDSVFPDLAESDVYVCGPTGWLNEVEADVRLRQLPSEQLHTERFDW